MNTTKLKISLVAAAFLVLAAMVVWQQWRARQLAANADALRQQVEQAVALRLENERLAGQLRAASERSQADAGELPRLRGQAARVRELEQENARLKADHDRLAKDMKSSAAQAQQPDTQETPERKLQHAKSLFGRNLGTALIRAADANGGNLLTELSGPLIETVEALSGAGQYEFRARDFEMVYTGSLWDVKAGTETVLAREREPVRLSDGRWMRLYLMADGSSRYIAAPAPDAFAAREKEFWPGQSR